MKIIPPWVKVLVILLLSGLLIGAFNLYGNQQFARGEKAERSLWLASKNVELVAANAKVKSLEEKYRQQERDANTALAVISFQYEKELHRVKTNTDRTIAGLRDGSVRLRIPVTYARHACGGAVSAVEPSPIGGDDATRADLSSAAAEFLVDLTSEADAVVEQLIACQAVVNADRGIGVRP